MQIQIPLKTKLFLFRSTTLSISSSSTIPSPPSFDSHRNSHLHSESLSLNSYATISATQLNENGGSDRTATTSTTASAQRFSFLEEIKALGENGTKRHLRPVNSVDSIGSLEQKDKSDTLMSTTTTDSKSKILRRLPFGLAGNGIGVVSGNTKEAETKQRQHGK